MKPVILSQFGESGLDTVYLPQVVSLADRNLHYQLTKTMQELRMAFVADNEEVRLDFSRTEILHAEGMLLFYAELTRLIDAFPTKKLSCKPSKKAKVEEVLQHLGVYRLLGHNSLVVPTSSDAVNWKVARAVIVDGEKAGKLIEETAQLSGTAHSKLYRSVSEAITNVSNHSHLAKREDGLDLEPTKEWWMFSREEKNSLYVAVCDLGIGIPRSLPRRHPTEVWLDAIYRMFGDRRTTDGRMIKAALRLRRTRTEEDYRGVGFSDITNVLHQVEGSLLTVYSNRGKLRYWNPTLIPAIRVRSFKNSILGTILVWSFPFRDDQNA